MNSPESAVKDQSAYGVGVGVCLPNRSRGSFPDSPGGRAVQGAPLASGEVTGSNPVPGSASLVPRCQGGAFGLRPRASEDGP
jgi:hypothetical protein